MVHSTKLLSVMAVAFLHIMLILVAMLQHGLLGRLARLLIMYLIALAFFSAMYTRRRLWLRHRRGGLYRGLGDTAVMLFAFMLAVVNSDDFGVPLPIAAGVRLVAAIVAAYFLHRVIIRPLEEEAPYFLHHVIIRPLEEEAPNFLHRVIIRPLEEEAQHVLHIVR
jgi:drug/metabolite transporter superfamily protein YnfA